jgi:hypothetical protein
MLANSQASGSSSSVTFDGLGDDGEIPPIGIYIIFLEAIREFKNSGCCCKEVVVTYFNN